MFSARRLRPTWIAALLAVGCASGGTDADARAAERTESMPGAVRAVADESSVQPGARPAAEATPESGPRGLPEGETQLDPELSALHRSLEARRRAREQGAPVEEDGHAALREHLAEQIDAQIADTEPELLSEEERERIALEIEGDALRRQLTSRKASVPGCVAEKEEVARLPGDLTPWVRLTRADFRAAPPIVADPRIQLRRMARLAVGLMCAGELEVTELENGRFVASIEGLEWFPVVSRGNSWWSDEARSPDEWVLYHEQVHFDLAELEARRMARRPPLREEAESAEAASRKLLERWVPHFEGALDRLKQAEQEYDAATDYGREPRKQREWAERTQAELRRLPAADATLATGPR